MKVLFKNTTKYNKENCNNFSLFVIFWNVSMQGTECKRVS